MNNDDVNQAIREKYGLDNGEDAEKHRTCPFCSTENQPNFSECRNCGRPLNLEKQTQKEEKQQVLERLAELEEEGILEKLRQLDQPD